MNTYVFLGPTLRVNDARKILDATYLPPVSLGDIARLMKKEPTVIAIIDGLFEGVPTVWHKEILFALYHGVRVFGSSSIGALRAAELHTFGMEGVGKIFERYRDGVYEDDDEVAVVHSPKEFDYRPLSEPMVNIREGLRRAQESNLIASSTHDTLLRAAKQMFYPRRSWPRLIEAGLAVGIQPKELDSLERFVRLESPNLKRDDAIALLNRVKCESTVDINPRNPDFTLNNTSFFQAMVAAETRPDCPLPEQTVRSTMEDDGPWGHLPSGPIVKVKQRASRISRRIWRYSRDERRNSHKTGARGR